jgi:subtilisin family serine protease
MEQQRARAATGLESADMAQTGIDVTISHQENIVAGEGGERKPQLQSLASRVQRSQSPILAELKKLGVQDVTTHSLTNAVTAKLTPSQLSKIAELDEVSLIRLEAVEMVTCMDESPNVFELPEARQDFNASGRGVRVAILDSGVDSNHPALLGKVVDEFDATGTGLAPGNHGTHVAGTVASNDPVIRGVAPQCDLLNIKVLNIFGGGVPASVINGLDQAVRRGARVVNLSLGWSEVFHGWVCNDADCILCQAVDNASRLGVAVVVAAGNEGVAAVPPFRIRHPGAARRAITVGAVDKAKILAGFSSVGPGSGRLSPASTIRLTKPDVSGPGVAIRSTLAGGGFGVMSGTSMASPHVAGLVALMLEQNSGLSPMMVKKILEESCEPIPYLPNQAGYGLINAYASVMRARAGVELGLATAAVS